MSIALPAAVLNLIQQNLLRKDIQVALRPQQMFRALVSTREKWDARVGETAIFTRNGYLPIKTKPKTPGVDPAAQNKAAFEQWAVTCYAYNDSISTNLPDSYLQIQNDVLRDARSIMIQAGATLNHIVRNKMYNTYLGGNTRCDTTATSSVSIHVESLAGFRETIATDGRMAPVSPANTIAVTIGAASRLISAVVPDSASQPEGPGTLTLTVALAVTAGDKVLAAKRPIIYRVGGAATYDGIVTGNKVTFADFRAAVAMLRTQNIPTFPDGNYHCQIDPTTEAQLFSDAEFQRILTGVPESSEWREFAIGQAAGITFFRNNEVPNAYNTSVDDYVAASYVTSGGVEIHRPILYGMGVMMEKYVPLDRMYAEAQASSGFGTAVVTDFNISQDQSVADLNMDGIKYIIRAPQDKLQENIDQTWSYKGDWACPSDSVAGTASIYKRAMVIEHAG